MSEYIGYKIFLDKFEINCKRFFTTVKAINVKLNDDISINFNYDYNLKENSENKENVYKFFIDIHYERFSSFSRELVKDNKKIYFIKYTNEDKIYLNDIINNNNIYGNVNDILYYINSTIDMYYLLRKLSTSANAIDYNLKKYVKKFNDVDSFIDFIRNEDKEILDIFLEKLSKNELSKFITNKYQYLIHANNFDLI